MDNARKGLLLVISGPSGVGKGTLASLLMQRDHGFHFSVSATTRPPRPGEIHGVHYLFMTKEVFALHEENGDFLETATVGGNRYGTPLKPVMQMLGEGRDLLLDIDTQGAITVMNRLADCVTVFILPPSMDELERRLRGRATECEADIQRRIAAARGEISQMERYRYVIINDRIDDAYMLLAAIVSAERHNTVRYKPEIG